MSRLTLSMIVKNEEKYLRECLESVKDAADEIVIVDTGSTDRTIEIAKEFNANIFHFEWINDFSAARNYALSKSTGEWILYLDADERIDCASIDELKRKIDDPRKAGFYCTVKSTDSNDSYDNSMRYVRLFANRPGINFSGKVHEQIEDSLNKNGYYISNSGIVINHLGYNVSKEEKQNKAKRNLDLLLNEYNSTNSPYYAYQLALTYNVLKDEENAQRYFLTAANSPKLERLYKAQCYSSLAFIAFTKNKITDAEKIVMQSLRINEKQPYAYFLSSKIYLRKGDLNKAEEQCRKAYDLNQQSKNSLENSGLNIILDDEELIYFGLYLSYQNKQTTSKRYFEKEALSFYKSKKSELSLTAVGLLSKIFQNSNLDDEDTKCLDNILNKNNLSYLLLVINLLINKTTRVGLLEKIHVRFIEENEVKKSLAKTYDELGKTDEAIKVLESDNKMLETDAAMMFYLLSYYLKKENKEKVNLIIAKLETNFNSVPEISARIKILKTKLTAFIAA